MSSILSYALRIMVVAVIAVATIWPDYGVVWAVIYWFPSHPFLTTVAGLIWVMILTLAAPLTVRQFRYISTLAFTIIWGVGLFSAYTYFPRAIIAVPWFVWAAGVVGLAFGWWKAATPLWRWANGIIAVQQTAPEHIDHGSN